MQPISSSDANRVVRSIHYSGSVAANSVLHLGVFLNGRCGGVMQFGSPLKKSFVLPLVRGTKWNDMMELNRMAFAEWLPRNSESRALSVAFKLIKRHYCNVEWILSFSDATQCGDGTIYRASGFVLTQIKRNSGIARFPNGSVIQMMTLHANPSRPRPEANGKTYFEITGGKYNFSRYVRKLGGEILSGFQLRYVKFLDPSHIDRLTVPVIPFEKIREIGATMYRGQRVRSETSDTLGDQSREGGATPTRTLHS